MQTMFLPNENGLQQIAQQLARIIITPCVIFLSGPLGAGKTTFVRNFLQARGYREKVKSPTYTLVEPYELDGCMLFHFDFYRIMHADELLQLGLPDYFSAHSICLVEWPEKGYPQLPTPDLHCFLDFKDQGRELRLEARTAIGEKILKQLHL